MYPGAADLYRRLRWADAHFDLSAPCVQAVLRVIGEAAAEYVARWLRADVDAAAPGESCGLGMWQCEYNVRAHRLTVVPAPWLRMMLALGHALWQSTRVAGGGMWLRHQLLNHVHVAVQSGWRVAVALDRQCRRMRLHVACACLRRHAWVPAGVRSYILAMLWEEEVSASWYNASRAANKLERTIGATVSGATPIRIQTPFRHWLGESYYADMTRSAERIALVKYGRWLTPAARQRLTELNASFMKLRV